jgi:hypothetical protein
MGANIFSRTMIEAIRKYRETLRKYLRQGERMQKLKQLGLKDEALNQSATSLYHTGYSIVEDINQNFDSSQTGYYSYNGVKKFAEYLKAYLDQFEVIKDQVVHKSQLASQALVKSIQLLSMPSKENLTIKVVTELSKCIRTIAAYGTEQQKELLERTLLKIIAIQKESDFPSEETPSDLAFYQSVLEDFQQHLGELTTP